MNLVSRLEALELSSNTRRPLFVWGNTKEELEQRLASPDLPKDRQIIGVCWRDPVSPEEERSQKAPSV